MLRELLAQMDPLVLTVPLEQSAWNQWLEYRATGATGAAGPAGAPGNTGPTGLTGPSGAPGMLFQRQSVHIYVQDRTHRSTATTCMSYYFP